MEPLRAGDFVHCTTSLRGWTAAKLRVLHETFFKDGKCAGIFSKVQETLSCRLDRGKTESIA